MLKGQCSDGAARGCRPLGLESLTWASKAGKTEEAGAGSRGQTFASAVAPQIASEDSTRSLLAGLDTLGRGRIGAGMLRPGQKPAGLRRWRSSAVHRPPSEGVAWPRSSSSTRSALGSPT
jgi:hypothetical protein